MKLPHKFISDYLLICHSLSFERIIQFLIRRSIGCAGQGIFRCITIASGTAIA
jgi:hypothetical protein